MKNLLSLGAVALAAGLAGFGIATAQNTNLQIQQPTAPARPQMTKLAKVATLETVEANQQFQRNVQIMQAQRQAVINLKNQLDAARPADKAKLQADFDAAVAKLNADNQTMANTYGYSLMRDYTLVVERSHIYMFVTDEEATRIEAEAARRQAPAPAGTTPARRP